MTVFDDIETARLILRLMPKSGLKALAKQNIVRAAAAVAADPDANLHDISGLAAMRLKQLRADPGYLPWSVRVMLLKDSRTPVGYCNFHAGPGEAELARYASGAVEIGYTIFPAHRRRGYAFEAVNALMAWARPRGGTALILSISPGNIASLRLADKLKAAKVGEHIDDEDGLEYVFATTGF